MADLRDFVRGCGVGVRHDWAVASEPRRANRRRRKPLVPRGHLCEKRGKLQESHTSAISVSEMFVVQG